MAAGTLSINDKSLKSIHSIFYISGITYSVLQRYHEALEAYLKADEFSPNNEKVLFNLGNLVGLSRQMFIQFQFKYVITLMVAFVCGHFTV